MTETQNTPELLQRIHRLHRQLNELAGRRQRAERRVRAAEKRKNDAIVALEGTKKEQTVLLLQAKERENLFGQSESALTKRRTQLSEAKNNKEYQSLKEQIDADQHINNRLADEVLDLMGKAENYSAEVEKAKTFIAESEAGIATAQKEWEAELPVLDTDIVHFTGALADAVEAMPRDFRGLYKRIVDRFGGEEGMAPVVEQKFCGSCRRQIPIQYIAKLCGNEPFSCQSCGRFLYIPEGFVLK